MCDILSACSLQVVLRDIKVTGPLTIEADYASGGYLNDKVGCSMLDAVESFVAYADHGLAAEGVEVHDSRNAYP